MKSVEKCVLARKKKTNKQTNKQIPSGGGGVMNGQCTSASCTMLWRLPNKEIKSYIGKTKQDKGF